MSLRMAVLSYFTRLLVKRRLGRVQNVAEERAKFEKLASLAFRAPAFSEYRGGELSGQNGPCPVTWVSRGALRSDDILFYIHGGGYIVGSPDTHKHMVAHLCAKLGIEAVMPRYRLAPEHPFPAGFDDVVACYCALVASGRDPRRIILGGDSAGGGMMLALLAYVCAHDMARPLCCFAMSPWTDLTLSGASMTANTRSDVILVAGRAAELREMYLQGQDPVLTFASPLFAAFSRCPPVLLHVADGEILLDDTLRMQNHLIRQGAEVLVRNWPNAFHVWHILRGWVPEAREALDDIARFVSKCQTDAEISR